RRLLALAGDANDRASRAATASSKAWTSPLGVERTHLAGWRAKALSASALASWCARALSASAGGSGAAAESRIARGSNAAGASRRSRSRCQASLARVLQLDLGLADVDEPPLAVLSHWVFITFAQETQMVGVFQLLQRNRVRSILVIELLDCRGVLF